MILFMWALFVVLNGRLTLEIALFGLGIAAAVFAFMRGYLGWSFEKERRLLMKGPALILYALRLFWEVVKANLTTLGWVYGRKRPESAIVTIHPTYKKRWQHWLLANSITLTPGTITVDLADGEMSVHALDAPYAEGLEESGFVRRLRKLEGGDA
jgi:multicomponent Na+:H+ antiporter subunit E